MVKVMKDSGVKWIGDIPEHWEVRKTKYILKERNEKNDPIKSDNILSLTMEQGVILYKDKKGGGNKAKEDLSAYKLAYPNDIVINSMNVVAGSVGLSNYFGCVSPVYYMLYSDSNEISINYYSNLFQSKTFQLSLMGLGNGIMMKESSNGKLNTIRMRIPMDKLKNVLLPVPPQSEQKKIVDFLGEKITHIDSIIEKTKQSIEEFKKYRKALITETVTKGLNTNVKMKDSGIKWIGEIPGHWEVSRIKYLIEFEPGKTELLEKNINCTFLPMEKLRTGKMNVDTEVLVEEVYSGYSYFKEKDIVLAKVTPCFENGNIAIAENLTNGIGFGTTEIFTIRPQKINTKFLFYRLQEQTFKEKGKSTMYGVGGLKRVPGSFITNYKIGVPSPEEQQQIVDYLDEKTTHIEHLIENKGNMISQLEEYKKSMIYEYVTGKKEVE
ncbi:restriction endonuclease subunit S [Marinilactibacillus psychrotolerans]|uniref:restriction endonuclease subunit S n=1 Tax=Marinilactibacillus psychrotolerans TaxID=191770 RepID=UPI0018694376|nr:restriction endonuclease subunit S [Marinilactibacillus psychrotolerans]